MSAPGRFDPYADVVVAGEERMAKKSSSSSATAAAAAKRQAGRFGLSTLFATSPYAPEHARLDAAKAVAAALKLPRLTSPGSSSSSRDGGEPHQEQRRRRRGRLLPREGGDENAQAPGNSNGNGNTGGGGGGGGVRPPRRGLRAEAAQHATQRAGTRTAVIAVATAHTTHGGEQGLSPTSSTSSAASSAGVTAAAAAAGAGAAGVEASATVGGGGRARKGRGGGQLTSLRFQQYAAHAARNLKHIDALAEAHKRRREEEDEAARREEAAAAKLASKVLKQGKGAKPSQRRQSGTESEAAGTSAAEAAAAEDDAYDNDDESEKQPARRADQQQRRQQRRRQWQQRQQECYGAGSETEPNVRAAAAAAARKDQDDEQRGRHSAGVSLSHPEHANVNANEGDARPRGEKLAPLAARAAVALHAESSGGGDSGISTDDGRERKHSRKDDAAAANDDSAAAAAAAAHRESRKFRVSYQEYLATLSQHQKHVAEQQAEAKQRAEEMRAKLAQCVLKKAKKRRADAAAAARSRDFDGDFDDDDAAIASDRAPASFSSPSSPSSSSPPPQQERQRRRKKQVGASVRLDDDDATRDMSATTGALISRLSRRRFQEAGDPIAAHRGGATTHRDGIGGAGAWGALGGSSGSAAAANEDMSRRIWRQKNRVPPGAKIFSMTGSYRDVRQSLLRRGWYENTDPGSKCFDLKWCLKAADIHETALVPRQIVNHFSKAAAITTKCGLGRSLENCSWFGNSDSSDFFPRSHELSNPDTIADWEADFKWSAAAAVLKRVILEGGFESVNPDVANVALAVCRAHLAYIRDMIEEDYPEHAPALPNLTEEQWALLLDSGCYTQPLPRDGGDQSWRAPPKGERAAAAAAAEEGEEAVAAVARAGCGVSSSDGGCGAQGAGGDGRGGGVGVAVLGEEDENGLEEGSGASEAVRARAASDDAASRESPENPPAADEAAASEASEGWQGGRAASATNTTAGVSAPPSQSGGRDEAKATATEADGTTSAAADCLPTRNSADTIVAAERASESDLSSAAASAAAPAPAPAPPAAATAAGGAKVIASGAFMADVRRVVTELARRVPQWNMDGCHNVWIVKPAGKSRGRGIQCFNSHRDIVKYTQIKEAVAEDKYIVQKYIETALIVKRRKFDIRQWVLVTDWNPLTIYFYDTCYFRFCASDYSLEDLSVYSHLSNNSIAKHSDEFKSRDVSTGNMWHLHTFREHLAETRGAEGAAAWEERVKPAMIAAVVSSLKCAVDMIENRKNSFDVYGYDFVLDDDLQAWLLEINASPSMEHSTPVTAELCAQVIDDTIKVVVDVPEQIKSNNNNSNTSNSNDDNGNGNGDNGNGNNGGDDATTASATLAKTTATTSGAASAGDGATSDAESHEETAGLAAAAGAVGALPEAGAGAGAGAGKRGLDEIGASGAKEKSNATVERSAAGRGGCSGAVIGIDDGLDRGRWRLVCKDASYVPSPAYCGLELTVTGSGFKPSHGAGKRKK